MSRPLSFACRAGEVLTQRRILQIELPEFALRALAYRVAVANDDAEADETVDLNDVIEWYLISPLTVKEFPHIEEAVPGFSGAFAKWLFDANYRPPEE